MANSTRTSAERCILMAIPILTRAMYDPLSRFVIGRGKKSIAKAFTSQTNVLAGKEWETRILLLLLKEEERDVNLSQKGGCEKTGLLLLLLFNLGDE